MPGDYITEKQLPMSVVQSQAGDAEHPQASGTSVPPAERSLEQIEREAILTALEAAGGNKSEAARRLGITRKTLHNKLKLYGV
jgi:two-component system, NtrC family, response regulator HydG